MIKRKNEKGFSLIELLAVIAIIAVIGAGLSFYIAEGGSEARADRAIKMISYVQSTALKFGTINGSVCPEAGAGGTVVACTKLKDFFRNSLPDNFKQTSSSENTTVTAIITPYSSSLTSMNILSDNPSRISVVFTDLTFEDCKALAPRLYAIGTTGIDQKNNFNVSQQAEFSDAATAATACGSINSIVVDI